MIILPSRYAPRLWSCVRGPRHQFSLGLGCGCCGPPPPPPPVCPPCGITTSDTLSATDTVFGLTWSLVFNASTTFGPESLGAGWSDTQTFAFSDPFCSVSSVDIFMFVFCSGTTTMLSLFWGFEPGSCPDDAFDNSCPKTTGAFGGQIASRTCTLSGACFPMSFTGTIPAEAAHCTLPSPSPGSTWGTLAGGSSDMFTVTS
jgi:hypothetical protein